MDDDDEFDDELDEDLPSQPLRQLIIDDPQRMAKFMISGAVAGAVSRTATAPIDRLKLLLQVQKKKVFGETMMMRKSTRGRRFFSFPPSSFIFSSTSTFFS